tara:strand:- start:295 stop:534 length:240 start_codon:yes stop_codon:yes gene_type:complete
MEDELKELKAELKDIKSITPNDNLRFLQNQIELGNIKPTDSFRILTILKRVELGLLSSENTIIKLRVELRELNKQIKNK